MGQGNQILIRKYFISKRSQSVSLKIFIVPDSQRAWKNNYWSFGAGRDKFQTLNGQGKRLYLILLVWVLILIISHQNYRQNILLNERTAWNKSANQTLIFLPGTGPFVIAPPARETDPIWIPFEPWTL